MTYDDLITALENTIFGQVTTAPILKPRKPDGAAHWSLEWLRRLTTMKRKNDEEQRIADMAVQAVFRGAGHKGTQGMGNT